MKKHYSYFCFFILSIYSAILISLEINVSQEYVRNFFTDIEGDVALYAVNTSLSVLLLLGTSFIFIIVLKTLPKEESSKKRIPFYRSQVVLFAYLGLDDRFLIHEYIGYVFKINDAFIFIGLGILEIILILAWNDYQHWSIRTKKYLLLAAAFSILMILIDGAFPREIVPRLSLEDLSKTWANAFIFMFAWSILMHNVNILKSKSYASINRNSITNKS